MGKYAVNLLLTIIALVIILSVGKNFYDWRIVNAIVVLVTLYKVFVSDKVKVVD